MKKIFASVAAALLTAPAALFACDGGTTGFDLPAPPPPTAVESVLNSVSNNAWLFIGLAVGTLIGAVAARRRTSVATPLQDPAA
jgi:hypothetical protein